MKFFGVSTDYLLKDELGEESLEEPIERVDHFGDGENVRYVSMNEAQEFLSNSRQNAWPMTLGIILCVLSAVPLLILISKPVLGSLGIKEDLAAMIGVVFILVLVAIGVGLTIKSGQAMDKFEYLSYEAIETEYGVSGLAKDLQQKHHSNFQTKMVLAVALFILSPVPIIASEVLWPDQYSTLAICLLLGIVSMGLALLIPNNIIQESIEKLLEEGDYTREKKESKKTSSKVAPVVFTLAAAIYLFLSFTTKKWDRTWLVWPVAAAINLGIVTILEARKKQAQR